MNIRKWNESVHVRALAGIALFALASGLAAVPARAQQGAADEGAAGATAGTNDQGAEIIVTAQRRSESIQDVPVAISAVGEQALKDQNVQSIEDVFDLVPNVNFQNNGSRDRRELSMRGISNQLNPYADVRPATYAFYIDEFNVVAGTSNPQIVDLERIEVLRGPQGTYFGRNSVGGAINVITNKPVNQFEGEAEVGYSSFDTWRAMGVLNVPVVDGLLAVRASGQYQSSDGYIKNINPVGGGNDSEFVTGRVQARLTPSDRFTWDVAYSYSDEVAGMRVGVPTGFITRTWRSVYYGGAQGDVADPDGVGFFPENRDRVNFNRPQRVGSEYQFITSRAVYEFDSVSLTAVGGHISSDVFNYGDVDGGSHDFYYEDLNVHRESTSGELRLQSTRPSTIEWSIGVMAGRDTGRTAQSTYHGAESPQGLPEGAEVTGLDSDSSTEYWAVFGQATWHISDMWSLIAGGRYSEETIDIFSTTRSNGNVTGVNDRETKFSDFSPRFTLTFKPHGDLLAYATASRGFKSGGTQASNNINLRNEYDPEILWNYEAGLKLDLFGRRLRLDATVFYMDWTDVQQPIRFQFLDENGNIVGVNGIGNAAAAHSYGVEFSADARISSRLRMSAQVGFLEAEYDDYPNAFVDGIILDASGKRLVNAPRWTLGAQAHYTLPINDRYDGFLRGEWNYRGEVLSSQLALLYDTWPFISPAYHNVNLRAGVESDRFRVSVYVENLFDAKYFANAYEKAFYSGVQVDPSYRNFGVRVGYSF
ncbi:TonB-dependent receptor [Sphingosinicella sp. CPCC 101087]|uniref:TonB-dependent receptor n=1 Tax=Sphingosinicella sp. CPCC 101087 TaxID=2497754 RepID=UPI00101C7EE2|nr:TonB-dependent receptor [Sphingosinicella sp. CPCC 101087]